MDTIYLVEDDEILRENFTDLISAEGYNVKGFENYTSALLGFRQELPALALLDISLENDTEAGFSLCQELRKMSDILPIIFFTSHASDIDKISGMRLGADDYLTKDISFEYLVVRIKALLRRVDAFSGKNRKPSDCINMDRLSIDLTTMSVRWDGRKVPLSLTQIYMLIDLTRNPGKIRTHQQLMNAAGIVVEPNTIAAHIKNIRGTIRELDPNFRSIITQRSAGYRWDNSRFDSNNTST